MSGCNLPMRLDKFLFFVRLTKTRNLAQKIIAEGHVRIDGKPVGNSHSAISPGSVITLPLHGNVKVIAVRAMPVRRGPAAEAQACYELISPQTPD